MSGQQLTPGAVVTRTGRTLYEVVRVRGAATDPNALVTLRSQSSGRVYSSFARFLWWPKPSGRGLGKRVVAVRPPTQRPVEHDAPVLSVARELAEGLGVRLVLLDDLADEALWIEEHSIMLVDRDLPEDRALAYLSGAVLGY